MQRIERLAIRIETDDEAVGARRRPRLDHAHGLDVRALHRLLERAPGAQPRRDPIGRIDLGHHAAPIARFTQHELDELGPRSEGGEPVAAAGGLCQSRRIDGEVSEHDLWRCAGRDENETMTPALADQHGVAVGAGAEGIAEPLCQSGHGFAAGIELEHAAGPIELQQVARPIVDAACRRAVGCNQRAVFRECQRIDGVERGIGERDARLLRRGTCVNAHFAPAECDGQAATGKSA